MYYELCYIMLFKCVSIGLLGDHKLDRKVDDKGTFEYQIPIILIIYKITLKMNKNQSKTIIYNFDSIPITQLFQNKSVVIYAYLRYLR